MKRLIVPILSVCMLCACGNASKGADGAEVADSMNVENAASEAKKYASSDLAMHELFGNVKTVNEYFDTADSTGAVIEACDEPVMVYTFDENGLVTSSIGSFQDVKYDITRNKEGKIVKLYCNDEEKNIEETIKYKYDGDLLVEETSEAFCELSGTRITKFTHDENGFVTRLTIEGNSDEVLFKYDTAIRYLKFDDKGNWTKALRRSDCTETIEEESSSYTNYQIVRRDIVYC